MDIINFMFSVLFWVYNAKAKATTRDYYTIKALFLLQYIISYYILACRPAYGWHMLSCQYSAGTSGTYGPLKGPSSLSLELCNVQTNTLSNIHPILQKRRAAAALLFSHLGQKGPCHSYHSRVIHSNPATNFLAIGRPEGPH